MLIYRLEHKEQERGPFTASDGEVFGAIRQDGKHFGESLSDRFPNFYTDLGHIDGFWSGIGKRIGGCNSLELLVEWFCSEDSFFSVLVEKGVYDVIVHNTFTREKEMEQYMEAAKEYGYRVVRLVVENTHGNTSVHGVPEKTMQSMRDRFSLRL